MTSLWQLTGPKISSDEFPAERDRDVIVIGAGLSGVATAVLLARAGREVTVVEARTIGAVTTGNTTGKLSLLQGTTLSDLRQHAGEDVLNAYVEANREGQAWLLREIEHRGIQVERMSAYTYSASAEGVESLDAELEACHVVGLPVEKVEDAGLPFEIAGALRLESQAQLQPIEVLASMVAELRELGGRVVEGCRVTDVDDVKSQPLTVATSLGDLRAELCVLATGTPILDRGRFFAKLEPSRSFVAAYTSASGNFPDGMYVSVDSPGRSLRTAAGVGGQQTLIVGGGAHVTGRFSDTREYLAELDDWTARNFGPVQRQTWWAAQDYRSHSRIPYAGPLPVASNRIFTATGYNKWGMTNAIAAALTISADVLGGNLEWVQTMRKHHTSLAGIGAGISANAAVAGKIASGWKDVLFAEDVDPDDLTEGEGVMTREGTSPVGVAKLNGEICKVSGICTHMGGILNWNAAEESWDCPLHGSRFDAHGVLQEGPAVHNLDRR